MSSSHGRLALSSVVAPRERLDEHCTPRPSGFRAFLAQPSGVIVSRGRRASGSTNAVLLDRAVSVPSSHYVWRHHQSWPAHERFCQRCIPRPSGSRAYLVQPSCVIVSRGRRASGSTNAVLLDRAAPGLASSSVVAAARAVRRTLYSSSERLPRLAFSSVVAGARAARRMLYSLSERLQRALAATRERFDERCTPRPSGSPPEQRGACRGHFLEHAC